MTPDGATLRRILARLPLDVAAHRACADRYRAIAEAHDAVADAYERGPESLPDTIPAPPPETAP